MANLKTKTPGTLTIATDEPVYEPWFVDDKPSNKKGFESAVAYAVAEKLGYTDAKVKWVRAHFDDVISPTPKKFDFDINEFSITDARKKVVDFSTGYYDVTQAVVTVKGSKIAGVTTIAGLKDAKLGAQKGTTSYDVIGSVIKPTQPPAVFNTNDLAVQALKNHQIDGLVVDLPTGALHRGGPGQGRRRARPVRLARHAGAVRPAAREGQPDHQLRLAGRRRAARGRHAEAAGDAVADRLRGRACPAMTFA